MFYERNFKISDWTSLIVDKNLSHLLSMKPLQKPYSIYRKVKINQVKDKNPYLKEKQILEIILYKVGLHFLLD